MLFLPPAFGQSPARRPAEAEKRARQLWDKLLTKCGDSYYLYVPPKDGLNDRFEQWQYKGFRFDVVPRALSPAERSGGVQWEGVAVMRASRFRSRIPKAKLAPVSDRVDPKEWDAWKKWADGLVPSNAFLLGMRPGIGDPPNVIWMKKEGGKWWFWSSWPSASGYSDSLSDLDQIMRYKPSCAELADKPSAN